MHELPEKAIIGGRYRVLSRLGSGGASTVYRVVQSGLETERALKVLDPHVEGAQIEMFERTFRDEIQLLSHLSHRNLAKILDLGSDSVGGTDIRFFVMEYANSGDLSHVAPTLTQANDLLRLFSEVFDALCYLHERNVLHCDIKPTNILVNKDPISGTLEAKLADLGVSKPLGSYTSRPPDLLPTLRDETYLWGTSKYAPAYAAEYLNQGKSLSRSNLAGYLPHYDLYCLGATLAETLSKLQLQRPISADIDRLLDSPKDVVRKDLSSDQWEYLCDFVRLLLEEDRTKGYKSAVEARDAFARINPQRAIPTRVPEIAMVGSSRVITYGDQAVRLSDRAYRVVAHPNFQRLQRLNQLNLVEAIYPEARQSRLSHSLEAFQLAKTAATHLLGDGTFRLHVSARDLSMFLVSSLLHDIGHYPLAHTIEDLRADIVDPECRPLADYDTVTHFLRHTPETGAPSIAKLLEDDWQVSVDEVARIVAKGDPLSIPESIFKQLLDGPIDIDKLAYLTRDSRFTGVTYGRGIDTEALISSLRLFSPTRYSVQQPVVGLAHKGIVPAESMIVARYHMFSRVYWHHTNRAMMAMIGYALKAVLLDPTEKLTFADYLNLTHGFTDIEALRLISTRFDRIAVREDSTVFGMTNPLTGILDGSREIYKRLVSFSAHPKNPRLAHCQMYLGTASQGALNELSDAIIGELSKLTGRKVSPASVLFDVPRMNKEKDALTETIVSDPASAQGMTQLNEISKVVGAVFTDFQWLAKKSRVFVSPALREDLRTRNLEAQATKRVEEIISHAARRHQ